MLSVYRVFQGQCQLNNVENGMKATHRRGKSEMIHAVSDFLHDGERSRECHGFLNPYGSQVQVSVRNGLSLFHGIQANCTSAREKKGMRALEEVALRMIKQCDI